MGYKEKNSRKEVFLRTFFNWIVRTGFSFDIGYEFKYELYF